MKKITYLLIAAISLLSVASCVKEIMPEPALEGGLTGQVFTVSLPDAETRTSLIMNRKTVWAKGDSLWVSNGVESEAVVVPTEAWDRQSFDFATKTVKTSEENPHIWVVYPYLAAAGMADGKVSVKIPSLQDGTFGCANICAAESWGYHIEMKNVTSVLKINVPDDAVMYSLSFTAAEGNALAGTCAVDFSGEKPVLTPSATTSAITVPFEGQTGDVYVSVIPGTFDPGFKVTAAGLTFEQASEVKETTVPNTVAVNDLVNLGSIGANMGPISGDGSQANPFLIENLGHMIAVAQAVNLGTESFAGKYLKVVNDISGIAIPVGYYPKSGPDVGVNNPFKGDFDGGNHTLTLSMDGADLTDPNRIGLFGALNAGAHVHDFVIEGQVTTTADAVAALAGHVTAPADADPVLIEDVINKASVNGANYVGGLVGYVTSTGDNQFTIKNCSNEGSISTASSGFYGGGIIGGAFDNNKFYKIIDHCTNSGKVYANSNSGGIVGNGYFVKINNCSNSGGITAVSPYNGIWSYNGGWKFLGNYNRGVGGIAGFMQNCEIVDCSNSGVVQGVVHIGGILGVAYWTNIRNCYNSGHVFARAKSNQDYLHFKNVSMVGGISGYSVHHSSIYDCENVGEVSGYGLVGGVAGYLQGAAQTYGNASDRTIGQRCVNRGSVTGENVAVGGVFGSLCAQQYYPTAYALDCENYGTVSSKSEGVGGIIGVAYNNNTSNDMQVLRCINHGDVTGTLWVGGIVGYATARVNSLAANQWILYLSNNANHGTVTATRSDKDGGEVAAGIIGTHVSGNNSAVGALWVRNCANYGAVQYAEITHKGVYVGGIVGRSRTGTIANVMNKGYVGPVGGVENKAEGADARLGAIVGSHDGGTLSNAYYFDGSCSQGVGTAGTQITDPDQNVRSFNSDGSIEPVMFGDVFYEEVAQALNAWITGTSYWTWIWDTTTQSPVFVK